MRPVSVSRFTLSLGLALLGAAQAYAQDKTACELISQKAAEAIVGVPLQPPQSAGPTTTPEGIRSGCVFTNYAYDQPRPPKIVGFSFEVLYSAAPNPNAVEEARTRLDNTTYDHPLDIPDLGDAAFWNNTPKWADLYVFSRGAIVLHVGPSELGLDKEIALARAVLGGSGKTGAVYGAPRAFGKPAPPAGSSRIDELTRMLAAKGEQGDVGAQLALGELYRYGALGADGTPAPDYAGAGYWFREASDRGDSRASYALGLMHRDGLGMRADSARALALLRKSADAGYVPAMVPLSLAYAAAKTDVSQQRATYWADHAAQQGDPLGWYITGYEWNRGWLGGDPPVYYAQAMEAYRKAADGGVCVALHAIGELYRHGQGVAQDPKQASEWDAKADACRTRELGSLWDETATLASMSTATGLHGERPPSRPAAAASELSPAAKQFLVWAGAAIAVGIALDAVHALFPGDPNAPAPSNDFDPFVMQQQVERELHEAQLWANFAAPPPPL